MTGHTPSPVIFPDVPNLWWESLKARVEEQDVELSPYLVVKREQVIMRYQSSCTDIHVLGFGSVPGLNPMFVVKPTFLAMLAKGVGCTLSACNYEDKNTHKPLPAIAPIPPGFR